MAQDIHDNPGLYYPEYLVYCRAYDLSAVDRPEWRKMAVEASG